MIIIAKMERMMRTENETREPADVEVAPVVVDEEPEMQEVVVYPGAIPVGMQLPTVRLTLTGMVMFPVHPGPTKTVPEGSPLLQVNWEDALDPGNPGRHGPTNEQK